MSLTELCIQHVRNIKSAKIILHPKFNFFYGPNGSGKTTLLESLYLLSSGHSFRTREIEPLITAGETYLSVFSQNNRHQTIGVRKQLASPTQVQINHVDCLRNSELAALLPSQVFYQDLFDIMDAGPSIRRRLLDWGLFHVKQSYHDLWKKHQQVLKQRNALLRQHAPKSHFEPWDRQLSALSESLHAERRDYFTLWSEVFQDSLAQLTDFSCAIHYDKGWDKKNSGASLYDVLHDQWDADCRRQYTASGAHQADIGFDVGGLKAKQTLSRGQQKLILIALKLAQTSLVQKPCVYLLDDVGAELDAQHVTRLMCYLKTLPGQFFMTAIDPKHMLEHFESDEYLLLNVLNV